MKRFLTILFTLAILLSLAGCGETNPQESPKDSTASTGGQEDIDLNEPESALSGLDTLIPEGWDDNNYGAYIYDVYDSEFLPDCFPAQIEGTLAYSTTFKDYTHDVLNQDYACGPVYFDSYADYSEYGVSFYADNEHLEQFFSALESKGMHGYMDGRDEGFPTGIWYEGFYGGNGWAMYLIFNTNDTHNDEFDGCLSVSATKDLYALPKSVSGIALPQTGIVTFDSESYTIQDFSEGYEDIDFDMANDSFPDSYFAAWVDYYGVCREDAQDYVAQLEGDGWTLEYPYTDEEDSYAMVLSKDGLYVIVDYENAYMQVGFSDMIENLTY